MVKYRCITIRKRSKNWLKVPYFSDIYTLVYWLNLAKKRGSKSPCTAFDFALKVLVPVFVLLLSKLSKKELTIDTN